MTTPTPRLTLNEVSERIVKDGGEVVSYFTRPRADLTRLCSFGGSYSAAEYTAIENLVKERRVNAPTDAARQRALNAHDRATAQYR